MKGTRLKIKKVYLIAVVFIIFVVSFKWCLIFIIVAVRAFESFFCSVKYSQNFIAELTNFRIRISRLRSLFANNPIQNNFNITKFFKVKISFLKQNKFTSAKMSEITDSSVSKSVFKTSISFFKFPISSAARSAAAGAGEAADFVLFLGFWGVSSTC